MSNSMKCKDARGMSCFAMAPGGYCRALQDTRFTKGGCKFYKSISTEIDSENASIGCVPDTEPVSTQTQDRASHRSKASGVRRIPRSLAGLFRRK
jgi:hypothetical protein